MIFNDFISFNQFIGLPEPLDTDIDVGYYDPPNMHVLSEPVKIDFYELGSS